MRYLRHGFMTENTENLWDFMGYYLKVYGYHIFCHSVNRYRFFSIKMKRELFLFRFEAICEATPLIIIMGGYK